MPNDGSLDKTNRDLEHPRLHTWLADGAQSIRDSDKS